MNAATSLRGLTNRPKLERYLVTPEGIEIPIKLASKGSRLGALVLDYIFFFIILWVIAYVMLEVAGGVSNTIDPEALESASGPLEFLYILFVLFLFFMRYGYFMAMELGPRSATWGKRIVGIRVAARGGGRLTPEAVIARNLIRDIEILAGAVWFAIFMFFPFFNKDNLRAGDVIAGTWVVEAPRTKLAETMSTSGAAATKGSSTVTGAKYEFGDEELSVYGEHELQVLERLLRQDKDDALGPVHETICRKIGWDPGAGDERAFLEAFYAQLRAKLEGDMRFGKRKADKNS